MSNWKYSVGAFQDDREIMTSDFQYELVFESAGREACLPELSIVMPIYNRQLRAEKAVASAGPLLESGIAEMILVDDGSLPVFNCDAIRSKKNILLVRFLRNCGANRARNFGLYFGRAKHIIFLDSDDEVLADRIEKMSQELSACYDSVGIAGSWEVIDGERSKRIVLNNRFSIRRWEIMGWNPVGPISKCIFKRSAVISIGGFDETLVACQDWEMYQRIVKLGAIKFSGLVVMRYSNSKDGITNNYTRGISARLALWSNMNRSCILVRAMFIAYNIVFFFKRGGFRLAMRFVVSLKLTISECLAMPLLPFVYILLFIRTKQSRNIIS